MNGCSAIVNKATVNLSNWARPVDSMSLTGHQGGIPRGLTAPTSYPCKCPTPCETLKSISMNTTEFSTIRPSSEVEEADFTYSCPGFEYRGACCHVTDLKRALTAGSTPVGFEEVPG